MAPKRRRLSRSGEFDRVYRDGSSTATRYLVLYTFPRKDEERDTEAAIVEDADKTDSRDRDLVHGDGGTIDLPVQPKDLSKDD